jgi:predicted GH43/DUF377 family glycosyl hydrolase
MNVRDIPLDKLRQAPFLFNGGIFQYQNQNYMVYRANWTMHKCKIFICKMDKSWNPTGVNWEIKVPILNNLFEDPRFICIAGKPYIAISQINLDNNCQFQGLIKLNDKLMYESYLKINYGDNWTIAEKQEINKDEHVHYINFAPPMTFEKNWCFFSESDVPCFIYRTQPVTILAKLNDKFVLDRDYSDSRHFNWPFGEIRGGAPAIKVDGIYYHFFHSSAFADPYSQTEENGVGRIYYMGCYTFQFENDEFKLLSQSRIPLEMGDYTQPVELWRNAAVFPCGVVFEDGKFIISYGWADYKLKLLTIDKKELIDLLTPLQIPVYLQNNTINLKDNKIWDAQEK